MVQVQQVTEYHKLIMKLLQDNKSILDRYVRTFRGDDTMLKGDLLEISMGGQIIPVDKFLWNSWTGVRYLNGDEYHGPVYMMGTSKLYDGSRICKCMTCQPQPHFRTELN